MSVIPTYEIIFDPLTKPELRGWYVIETINGHNDIYGPYADEAQALAKEAELTGV